MTTTENNHDHQNSLSRRLDDLQTLTARLKNDQLQYQKLHEQYTSDISQLMESTDTSSTEYEEAANQVDEIKRKISELLERKKQIHSELQLQKQGRLLDQLKQIDLENELASVTEQHETLVKKDDSLRARQKSMKCRVCGKRGVEFALLPCFHFCYCEPCVKEISVCIICDESKQGIQKIYYG
ncbi:hypothetical protein BDC45DRAFT_498563 [Circinella umbellata]|nr:hypothetical protein BDC45DRAFT_498563 [Circinella umbellata]